MKIILKHKKKILLILTFIIMTVGLISLKISIERRDKQNKIINSEELLKETIETEPEIISEEVVEEKILYYVDIKGAVAKPGVYALEKGKRVNDVIALAGGLTKNADTSLINLAKIVWDQMMIVIYTKDEVIKSNTKFELNTKVNDAYQKENDNTNKAPVINNEANTNKPTTDTSTSTNDKTTEEEKTQNTIININTATLEELMTLSGIGESKAQAIIEYREANGNFSKIEDIMNVSGIGEKAYEKIKECITV